MVIEFDDPCNAMMLSNLARVSSGLSVAVAEQQSLTICDILLLKLFYFLSPPLSYGGKDASYKYQYGNVSGTVHCACACCCNDAAERRCR